jgi:signal transduction histidine kinase
VAIRTRDLITINRLLQEEVLRRTAVQKELEARQKDLETILEAMPIPLVVTDLGWGPVHYANRAFHQVSRRRPGRRPLRTFFERSPILAPDGSCSEGELVFKASKGEPRTMVVQTAPIRFRGDGEVVVGFLDVTVQKALERDLLTISEHERETLGRDLHDDICQRIAGVSFLMTALSRALEQESHPLAGRSREASATLADSLQRVRQYSRGLFPIELEDSGLLTSLRSLVSRSPREEGPELHFETNLTDQKPLLAPDAELQLYRITQEALNNAVVHSGGTSVKISLVHGRRKLVLEVADNGSGLGPSRWGIGMRSMQYRSSQIGASFNCVSDLGVGTRIRVEVPLNEAKKETPWVLRSS